MMPNAPTAPTGASLRLRAPAAMLLLLLLALSGCQAPGPGQDPATGTDSDASTVLSVPTAATGPPHLEITGPTTAQAATAPLTIKTTPGILLEIRVAAVQMDGTLEREHQSVAVEDAAATQNVSIGLRHGRNRVTLTADDGSSTVQRTHDIVRPIQLTVAARFNGYPGHTDRDDTFTFDPSAGLSGPMYDDVATTHPSYATVHDALVAWEAHSGVEVSYSHSDSFGFGVERIDGAGNPVDSSAPPWWCYTLNGEPADFGITLQGVAHGDVVVWDLGTCTAM